MKEQSKYKSKAESTKFISDPNKDICKIDRDSKIHLEYQNNPVPKKSPINNTISTFVCHKGTWIGIKRAQLERVQT